MVRLREVNGQLLQEPSKGLLRLPVIGFALFVLIGLFWPGCVLWLRVVFCSLGTLGLAACYFVSKIVVGVRTTCVVDPLSGTFTIVKREERKVIAIRQVRRIQLLNQPVARGVRVDRQHYVGYQINVVFEGSAMGMLRRRTLYATFCEEYARKMAKQYAAYLNVPLEERPANKGAGTSGA